MRVTWNGDNTVTFEGSRETSTAIVEALDFARRLFAGLDRLGERQRDADEARYVRSEESGVSPSFTLDPAETRLGNCPLCGGVLERKSTSSRIGPPGMIQSEEIHTTVYCPHCGYEQVSFEEVPL